MDPCILQCKRCRYWLRCYFDTTRQPISAAPADELDIDLKRKWFDAPTLDFAHIHAGISKHLRMHMSPIGPLRNT